VGTELELAKRNQLHSKYGVSRDFITIISEDFENGAEDWETFDETGISDWIEYWHLSTTGAYEGNSWWMGDEELGGYTDHRYLVLDTPELVLADENPELHFWFSLCCEDVGGDPPMMPGMARISESQPMEEKAGQFCLVHRNIMQKVFIHMVMNLVKVKAFPAGAALRSG